MIRSSGSRSLAFLSALLLLVVVGVGVPSLLIVAARARFGGGAPLHGVASPGDWQFDRIATASTERLTEQTIADVVIRSSLIVVWVAVAVLVLTVLAEIVHMVRHHGLAMPDMRGLGLPQSIARLIATGLLVVMPSIASPTRAVARDGVQLVPRQQAISTLESVDMNLAVAVPVGSGSSAIAAGPRVEPGRYVVRAGDSIYGIAERLAGRDPVSVAEYAERLLDLNLDTTMPDGQRFTNAAFIDVGWVLELPSPVADDGPAGAAASAHVVERGESLWSIAGGELGDGRRWPEIFESNEGRSFEDGRRLVDPDLIQPGWSLDLPTMPVSEGAAVDVEDTVAAVAAVAAVDAVAADDPVDASPVALPPQPLPARPDNVWAPGPVESSPETQPGAENGGPDANAVAQPGGERVGTVTGGLIGAELDNGQSDPQEWSVPEYRESGDVVSPVAASEQPSVAGTSVDPSSVAPRSAGEAPELLTLTRAAMLAAGALTLLGVRRRNQLRHARPRSRLPIPAARLTSTERALRSGDEGGRLGRLCSAINSVAEVLAAQGQRVIAALVGSEGDLELRFSGPVDLAAPWHGHADVWKLSGSTAELAAPRVGQTVFPCPTLVQIGCHVDGRDVYVDLEACGAIEVAGVSGQADAIVVAIAMTLAASTLAEVTTLVGLGVSDAAFLGHRLHMSAHDDVDAIRIATQAIGTTATAGTSTFALRVKAAAGETWEPAAVLAGSTAGAISLPNLPTGLAVVSASPIVGPSYRLAPDGDAWALQPLGIRLTPIGVSPDDVASIVELVEVAPAVPVLVLPFQPDSDVSSEQPADFAVDVDAGADTRNETDGVAVREVAPTAAVLRPAGTDPWEVVTSPWRPTPTTDWELLVRLIGPVEVSSRLGGTVDFERSKTRELVAWLATHRGRSTRTAARTALWELDVRDATFSNVVSEARRSMARLVTPPEGEEWVGRTMTEALPLHELVVTDADLVEQALEAARLQPPAQAIATLTPAVELINGMPFEGTSYLWPDAEGITSNLVLLATSAAAELAAHCLSLGDIDGVFRATGRGLRALPGHEELIGLRMQAHAGAGDHAGVRQEWESYERVITADPWSDGEPASKLVELRHRLLNPSR